MIQKIIYKKKLLAIIIEEKKMFKPGVNFITPNSLPLQLGFICHKSNTFIKPHTHNNYLRKIKKTTEILLIKKGKLRVDFYYKSKKYLFSKIVNKNRILILIDGSHGFKILKNSQIIEIKQGPFSLALDKKRFNKVDEKYIKIKK
ncbi:hypothetical protein OAS21_00270 [Pelagibacteraceae bacterium]|jgi:hypothetical protein|nr:hypothetical protein [Pelagibacteraceae bacterium]|tara:strand:+ start:128 stop:562 length:435 start_codon:yes stop_codon:yes gene_type:complete